jgi:hypothetical protein
MTATWRSIQHEHMGTVAARPAPRKSLETSSCDALALLRLQVEQAQQLLEQQVVAAAERIRSCPALYRQVLSLYAHCLCIEDITTNVLLRSMPPVHTHMWHAGHLTPWELASMQAYAQKVHMATGTLLAGLTPSDLRVGIDLSDAGLGWTDTMWVLNRFILFELAMTCGALAAKQPEGTKRRSNARVRV